MSLEDLAAALRKEADEECRALMQEARRHSLTVHERCGEERRKFLERETRDLARTLEGEGMTLVYQASLEIDGEREGISKEFLARVRSGALERLDALRDGAGYPALFAMLAARALAGMTGPVTLRVDRRDEELARALPPRGTPPAIVASITTRGGAQAESSEGRIRADATLETCLDRFLRDASPGILRMLGGDGG